MHKLLTKKTAMDAMNEALLTPSDYPGTDPDYNPGYFKGTEPEQIKHGSHRRKAEVDQHTAPKILPPRTELRSHIDEELKAEIKADKEATALSAPAAMAPEPKFEKDPNDPPPFRSLYGGPVDRSKIVTLKHNKDWAGAPVKRPQSKLLTPRK
jgi:hypothetical protein